MSTKITADYWNMRGETYSRSWKSEAKKRLSRLEIDFVHQAVELAAKNNLEHQPLRVLEIGVGTGRIAETILNNNIEYYGTDISQTMVDYCTSKFSNNAKVRCLLVHDILYPVPRDFGSFDVVIAMRVLAYSKAWQEELANIHQAMNVGGYLVFSFPNRYSSIKITRFVFKGATPTHDLSYKELTDGLRKIGFHDFEIIGFARLFDLLYDWCNSKFSTNILYAIENILRFILGSRFLTRLFYIRCKKI